MSDPTTTVVNSGGGGLSGEEESPPSIGPPSQERRLTDLNTTTTTSAAGTRKRGGGTVDSFDEESLADGGVSGGVQTSQSAADRRAANKVCRVCGDKAFGYNFNVVTCESCKAFFRRNAIKDKDFRCPFTDSCDITVISRRFCQKCRLTKCFAVGMKKEWILTDDARVSKKARIAQNREKKIRFDDADYGGDESVLSVAVSTPGAQHMEDQGRQGGHGTKGGRWPPQQQSSASVSPTSSSVSLASAAARGARVDSAPQRLLPNHSLPGSPEEYKLPPPNLRREMTDITGSESLLIERVDRMAARPKASLMPSPFDVALHDVGGRRGPPPAYHTAADTARAPTPPTMASPPGGGCRCECRCGFYPAGTRLPTLRRQSSPRPPSAAAPALLASPPYAGEHHVLNAEMTAATERMKLLYQQHGRFDATPNVNSTAAYHQHLRGVPQHTRLPLEADAHTQTILKLQQHMAQQQQRHNLSPPTSLSLLAGASFGAQLPLLTPATGSAFSAPLHPNPLSAAASTIATPRESASVHWALQHQQHRRHSSHHHHQANQSLTTIASPAAAPLISPQSRRNNTAGFAVSPQGGGGARDDDATRGGAANRTTGGDGGGAFSGDLAGVDTSLFASMFTSMIQGELFDGGVRDEQAGGAGGTNRSTSLDTYVPPPQARLLFLPTKTALKREAPDETASGNRQTKRTQSVESARSPVGVQQQLKQSPATLAPDDADKTKALRAESQHDEASPTNEELNERRLRSLVRASLSTEELGRLTELLDANEVMSSPMETLVKTQGEPAPTDVVSVVDVVIRRIIKMCKRLNAFRNLCQDDQVALLKGGCTEVAILRGAMHYDVEANTFCTEGLGNNTVALDFLKKASLNVYEEHRRFLREFDEECRKSKPIMLILGAITLFTPTRPQLTHAMQVQREQDAYHSLLKRYLEALYADRGAGGSSLARATYARLCEKLRELHTVNGNALRWFLGLKAADIKPLLMEIFDLKRMF